MFRSVYVVGGVWSLLTDLLFNRIDIEASMSMVEIHIFIHFWVTSLATLHSVKLSPIATGVNKVSD